MNFRKNLLTLSLLSLLSITATSCGGSNGYQIEDVDNAGGSAFYEIFVGSFCDSNGDGVGDLNGIKSKLDYLKKLGVSGLWLTPIHPSPSYHHYDVSDYYAVSPDFGTLEDFTSLCETAKEKGIKVIIDMVFNHTAKNSKWFDNWVKNAGNKNSPYYDNYIYSRTPKYGYALDQRTNLYIESNFSDSMPELNLDNENVRAELAKIQDFWLDKGASGFRYDAVKYYYCENNNGTIAGNTEKNVEMMKFLADSARKKKSDAYLVGENWVDDRDELTSYAASGMDVFYFPTSGTSGSGSVGNVTSSSKYDDFATEVKLGLDKLRSVRRDANFVCFVSNHDQDRWGSYQNGHANAQERRKLMVSSYLLTPGTPFMYYGEEIEMLGTRGSKDMTDAMRRQAMVWGEDAITCKQPENYTVDKQTSTSVKDAEADPWSFLNHYRKVLSIRNKYNMVFHKGNYETVDLSGKQAYAWKITFNGENYYLYHNCSGKALEFSVSASAMLEDINTMKENSSFSNGTLTLKGYSSVLLK